MSLATFIHSTNTHRLSLCEHRPIGERGPLPTKELVAQQEARTHPQLTGIPFDGDEDSDGGERAPGGRINRDGMRGGRQGLIKQRKWRSSWARRVPPWLRRTGSPLSHRQGWTPHTRAAGVWAKLRARS